MNDNITRLDSRSKPREATCTHKVPGMAVHPPKRSSDLRSASENMDTLHRLGFGKGMPHSEGSRRVGTKLLREWRCWHLQQAAAISEILGDDTTPGGAA